MNDINLMTFDEKEIKAYIRGVLTVNGERLRFDMSGYDDVKTGDCTLKKPKHFKLVCSSWYL